MGKNEAIEEDHGITKELMEGTLCIGNITYNGEETKVYLSNDRDHSCLPVVLVGPSRAGKSVLLGNLAHDAIRNGECVILPDFTGDCELSKSIASIIDKDKVLTIKFDDLEAIQGMGWNEIPTSEDPVEQYISSKKKTALLLNLIRLMSNDVDGVTDRMERILWSASMVVELKNGPIKDISGVLSRHNTRHEYTSSISAKFKDCMSDYIQCLQELDEQDETGRVTGTRMHLVSSVLDRLHRLKSNSYIEAMTKKGTKHNINLVNEVQKSQLIIIEMTQKMFISDHEKDIFAVYWLTKIHTALQVRNTQIYNGKVKVNLVIDDLYSADKTEAYLKEILFQLPQLNTKLIISCHYLNQLKKVGEHLRSTNSSYVLLSGCDRRNFVELRNELHPFNAEDLLELKRYHSLNIIKTAHGNGYTTFVTKLPRPVSFRLDELKKSV